MSSFTILVDSSADLPLEYVKKHDLKRLSLAFHLNNVTYNDDDGEWKDISAEEFYTTLGNGGSSGTTLINPETFVEVFSGYAEKNEPLLEIGLSGGLSGTAQNAVIALDEVKEKYPKCQIYPIDTLTAAAGASLIAILAVEKRAEGASLEDTAKYLNDIKQRGLIFFTVDDLNYLHRGGRLSKFSAVAGSLIGVKPLLNVSPEGTLQLKDKARGRKAALETLAQQIKRSLNPDTKIKHLVVSHGNCREDAEKLVENVKALVEVENVMIEMMGPVIGAHTGPGSLAISFLADMTRKEYEEKFYPGK